MVNYVTDELKREGQIIRSIKGGTNMHCSKWSEVAQKHSPRVPYAVLFPYLCFVTKQRLTKEIEA